MALELSPGQATCLSQPSVLALPVGGTDCRAGSAGKLEGEPRFIEHLLLLIWLLRLCYLIDSFVLPSGKAQCQIG